MEKSLINEINRQRQIMGLNPILIKEDTGFGSIGEFFANAIKSLSKETSLLDDAGKAIVKIGDDLSLTSKQFDELILNIRNGNYASISDETLDTIAKLIRRGSNEEGVKYIDTLMNKVDESLKEINPNSSIDEWADITAKNAESGLRTIDESIDTLTNNNPLLKKVLKDSLESKVNTAIGLIRKTAQDASDAASKAAAEESERLSKMRTGELINRIRNRNPNFMPGFSDEVGWKFLYTWRYSPLTKMIQWMDLGKLIESLYLIRNNRDELLNNLLDDFENLSSAMFNAQRGGEQFGDWITRYNEKINLMMQQMSAWKPLNDDYDKIVDELVNMYSRNPELDNLTKEMKAEFIEQFRDVLKHSNPATSDFPTFLNSLYLLIRGFKTEQLVDLTDSLAKVQEEINKKSPALRTIIKIGGGISDVLVAIAQKIEAHAFTGTIKSAKKWAEEMDSRPYLIPIYRKIPNSNPYYIMNWSLGKYSYWWVLTKFAIPTIWGIIDATYQTILPFFGKGEVYGEDMGDIEVIWHRIIDNIFKNINEQFTIEIKQTIENPEMAGELIEETERHFSLLKSILPVPFGLIRTYNAFINVLRGKYQKIANDWMRERRQDAEDAVENATGEARETGREIIHRIDSTAQEIRVPETPEIDSTLLRQQTGPVEGSDDPNSPNYSYELLINAWNNANQNDKITDYNTSGNKVTYRGKNGTVSFNAAGVMYFVSDDRSFKKLFDGYTSGGTQR